MIRDTFWYGRKHMGFFINLSGWATNHGIEIPTHFLLTSLGQFIATIYLGHALKWFLIFCCALRRQSGGREQQRCHKCLYTPTVSGIHDIRKRFYKNDKSFRLRVCNMDPYLVVRSMKQFKFHLHNYNTNKSRRQSFIWMEHVITTFAVPLKQNRGWQCSRWDWLATFPCN